MVGPTLVARSARAAALLFAALALAACPGPPVNTDDAGNVQDPMLFYDGGGGSLTDGGPDTGDSDGGDPTGDAGPGDTGLVGIDAVTPPNGPLVGGNRVRIEGFGFTPPVEAGGDTRVFFGEREAENVLYLDDRRLTAFVPGCEVPGPVTVRVENSLGVAEVDNVYTCFSPVTLVSLSPAVGSSEGGTEVTLSGEGFNDDMVVLVDGRQVVELLVGDDGESASFLTPPGRAGRVDVEALDTFGRSVLPLAFTYENGLELRRVSPAAALPGAYVDVHGAGFRADALVRIGGESAPVESLVHEGRLYVQVPAGLASGAHDVEVELGGETVVLEGGFFALPPAAPGVLAIHGAVPSEADAAGGTVVHLAGDGFTETTLVSVGGADATSFEVLSDRLLELVAPAGSVGPADIVVETSDLGGATFAGFAFVDKLAVTGVDPASGPAAGGTALTLEGRGFASGMTATLGGLPLADLVVVSDTEATATAPAGASGPVDLVVRTADEQARLRDAFLYEAELKVLGVHPSRGGMSGGTFVTVRGQGFAQGGSASLLFGTAPATNVEVVSDSLITARTPMREPGVVDVSVTLGGETATATGAFSFFDPTILAGGTRGGDIDGAVYFTALDAFLGQPIPDLAVFLGTDGDGQHLATTNMFGQATLSGPDVMGPQTVSVVGDGWEYATLIDVNATEITLYLQPLTMAPPTPGEGPPPPPPATLRGRVFGFAKEFFDPAALGPDEIALAVVVTTARDEFSGTPNPGGQNVVFQEGGEYFIANSRTGRLAVVAMAGIFNLETGQLRLRQMGVRRAVHPERGVDLLEQDIELTIRLDEEIDLSLPDAPVGLPDGPTITRVVPFLRFGGEGALAYTDAVDTSRNHALETMPKVPGEMLTFIAGAYTTDGQGLIDDVGSVDVVQGEPFAYGTGTAWMAADPFTGQPLVNGRVLVVKGADGEHWATTVAAALDNGTLLLERKAPFTASSMSYHVGNPTYPSSVVRQNGTGDLIGGVTIAPVLGMPEALSPLPNGVLEQRTLRWKPAVGQQPTNHMAYVYDPFEFAVLWTFYLDGARTKAPIPRIPAEVADLDLGDNAAPKDMPLGGYAWQHMSMYAPGFDYDNFSNLDIGSRARRAWTTDVSFFIYPGD